VKKAYERAAKRKRERTELVAAISKAFRFHYMGRDNIQGRTVLEVVFEPDPTFRPSSRYASIYKHVRGRAWVDESSAQIVRLNAELFEDASFGGGLVAKVYRGSRLILEQREVQPGVWMPTHTSYDLEGRLFLFPANFHQQLEAGDYRRIGLPQEALPLIRREHPEQAPEQVTSRR